MDDPYRTLGVSRTADQKAIKAAYKKLARKYHPDKNSDPGAEERFKRINAAYDVVGDAEKRELWDEFGEASTRPGFDANRARQFRTGFGGGASPFGGFEYQGGNMDDILSSIFGGGGADFRTASQPRRGSDQRAELAIDFMTAVTGGEHLISVRRPDGHPEQLTVRIPAGVSTGSRLRLRGQGLPPPGGGPCGDLHLELTVRDHPVLRREGDDLELDVPVTILEAMKGGTVAVPTPTGDVKVKIPKGLGSGKRLRLKGRGVQTTPPGDLFLILRPTVPDGDAEDLLMAAQRLEEAYVVDVRAGLKL